MKYMPLIHQGTAPTPPSDEWERHVANGDRDVLAPLIVAENIRRDPRVEACRHARRRS
jgi:hypothetical protein